MTACILYHKTTAHKLQHNKNHKICLMLKHVTWNTLLKG